MSVSKETKYFNTVVTSLLWSLIAIPKSERRDAYGYLVSRLKDFADKAGLPSRHYVVDVSAKVAAQGSVLGNPEKAARAAFNDAMGVIGSANLNPETEAKAVNALRHRLKSYEYSANYDGKPRSEKPPKPTTFSGWFGEIIDSINRNLGIAKGLVSFVDSKGGSPTPTPNVRLQEMGVPVRFTDAVADLKANPGTEIEYRSVSTHAHLCIHCWRLKAVDRKIASEKWVKVQRVQVAEPERPAKCDPANRKTDRAPKYGLDLQSVINHCIQSERNNGPHLHFRSESGSGVCSRELPYDYARQFTTAEVRDKWAVEEITS